MPRVVHVKCGDGSELTVHYIYHPGRPATRWEPEDPPEWEMKALYHEMPMAPDAPGRAPTAQAMTDLRWLIPAIECYEAPFEDLYTAIENAIAEAENDR